MEIFPTIMIYVGLDIYYSDLVVFFLMLIVLCLFLINKILDTSTHN